MEKKECLLKLGTVNSCYAMGILSSYILSTADNSTLPSEIPFENLQYPEKRITFDVSLVKNYLAIEQNRIQLVSEFTKSLVRTLIHNSYELVFEYATETNQKQKLFGSELITFTRLLRNNVGHNHKFRFRNEKDIQRLKNRPVKWKDKIITLGMEGKKIPLDLIDPASVTDLFLDIIDFVQNKLT